ncbi:hypothetical protein [Akkermansia glycaniphila]|uniref:Uncharacterized protein n=1 Tax=Akkermansia glycaniphila TaxID=1679444 RepID=A0A1H6KFN3_9BACT|nr:hypothetical protein [Akkermansia glycaniphila]SEH70311.1 Hypothetical protein PYTT_0091 [Akkermansia glycaniphila]
MELNAYEILPGCFPPELGEDVAAVIKALSSLDPATYRYTYHASQQGKTWTIPSTIYHGYNEDHWPHVRRRLPHKYDFPSLSDMQKTILNCILLRHQDTDVVHQALKQILACTEIWMLPFSFPLLGIHHKAVLFDLWEHIVTNMDRYLAFIKENRKLFHIVGQNSGIGHCKRLRQMDIRYQILRELKRRIQPFPKEKAPDYNWP